MARSKSGLSWQQVRGLLANAIYGGRIDNQFDFRKLEVYLQLCFSDGIFVR